MDPYLRTSWKVKQVLLLLLQVASLSSCNQTLLPIYPCNSSPTSRGTTHGTEARTVRPTWIDPTVSQVGLLQTPNFPRPFALPLECLWIFDLTGLSRQAKTNYLHFYFTQVIHNFKRRDYLLGSKKSQSPKLSDWASIQAWKFKISGLQPKAIPFWPKKDELGALVYDYNWRKSWKN